MTDLKSALLAVLPTGTGDVSNPFAAALAEQVAAETQVDALLTPAAQEASAEKGGTPVPEENVSTEATSEGNEEAVPSTSNQPEDAKPTKASFMREFRRFGENEAAGANARPALANTLVEASYHGAIVEDDADAIFETYQKGVAARKGLGQVKQGSQTQQVSKMRTFIKMGAIPGIDARETMIKAGDAIRAAREANGGKPLAKSPFDAYLSVARTQLQFPDAVLDDETIQVCINPAPRDEKLEVDKLDAIAVSMDNLRTNEETSDDSANELEKALDIVLARIREMGGSTRMKKNAEKAAKQIEKLESKKKALQQLRTH